MTLYSHILLHDDNHSFWVCINWVHLGTTSIFIQCMSIHNLKLKQPFPFITTCKINLTSQRVHSVPGRVLVKYVHLFICYIYLMVSMLKIHVHTPLITSSCFIYLDIPNKQQCLFNNRQSLYYILYNALICYNDYLNILLSR